MKRLACLFRGHRETWVRGLRAASFEEQETAILGMALGRWSLDWKAPSDYMRCGRCGKRTPARVIKP